MQVSSNSRPPSTNSKDPSADSSVISPSFLMHEFIFFGDFCVLQALSHLSTFGPNSCRRILEISEEAKVQRLRCLAWKGGRLLTKQSNFPAQRQSGEQSIIRPESRAGRQGRETGRQLSPAADAPASVCSRTQVKTKRDLRFQLCQLLRSPLG